MKARRLLLAGLLWIPLSQAPGQQLPEASIQLDAAHYSNSRLGYYYTEGSTVSVTITLDRDAPALTTGSVVLLHVDEQELTHRPNLTEYIAADEGTHAVFIPPGERTGVVNLQLGENTWVDISEVTVNLSISASHNVIASDTESFKIEDNDEASVALRNTFDVYRENEGRMEFVVDMLEGVVNDDFTLVLVNFEGSASRHNDFNDGDSTGTLLFKAGRKFQPFSVRIVDSNQIENGESFDIRLFGSGLTSRIKIVCHPTPGPRGCVTGSAGQRGIDVRILDDDVARVGLDEFHNGYYGRFTGGKDRIDITVHVLDENGDCIIPFPIGYTVQATGDTQVLSNTVDNVRFPPCTAEKSVEFNLKPAAELSPGIYTLHFSTIKGTVDPEFNNRPYDSKFYTAVYSVREHWTVQVCHEGNGIVCTGSPTIEHGPPVTPPVIPFSPEPVGGGRPTQPPIGSDPYYGSGAIANPTATSSRGAPSVYESSFFQPNVPEGVTSHIGVKAVEISTGTCARFDNPLFLEVLAGYSHGKSVTGKLDNANHQICSGPATDQFHGCSLLPERSWLDPTDGLPKLTTNAGAEYRMFCVEPLFDGVQDDWSLIIHIDHATIN